MSFGLIYNISVEYYTRKKMENDGKPELSVRGVYSF